MPGPAAVAGLVPPAGGGRTVITSQFGSWPGRQVLEVPVLDREVAAGFLLDRTGAAGAAEEAAASELAGELGGLPLALEQAGAYMQASGRNLAAYLGLFRARRAELLGRGDPAGYDKRVATTWSLAFARLGRAGPAAGLLRLVACCAAEDIPLDLLLRPGPAAGDFAAVVAPLLVPLLDDELARDEAVAGLRRFSLISAPRGGLVSVHRLVQAITLDQLSPDEAAAWRQAAAAVIEAALPDDPQDPGSWSVFAALLPHAQAGLDPASYGMYQVARYLGASGSYAAALAVQRQILHAYQEAQGAEHPDTLTARTNLASLDRECGGSGRGPGPVRRAGAGQRTRLGRRAPRHAYRPCQPGPLDRECRGCGRGPGPVRRAGAGQRARLGRRAPRHAYRPCQPGPLDRGGGGCGRGPGSVRRAGAGQRARLGRRAPRHAYRPLEPGPLGWGGGGCGRGPGPVRSAAADPSSGSLGAEHPGTLTVRANLAHWTGNAGDAAGARDQFATLLPVRERVLGAEHPHTLTDRANLAFWTGEAGDAAGARDQFAALAPVLRAGPRRRAPRHARRPRQPGALEQAGAEP